MITFGESLGYLGKIEAKILVVSDNVLIVQAGPSMMCIRRFLIFSAWLAQNDIAKEGQHACTM